MNGGLAFLLLLHRALARRRLVRRRLVGRLENDEPGREDAAAVLVEVDHRVVLVDFDERAGAVGRLRDAVAFRPVLHHATSAARGRPPPRHDCPPSRPPRPNPPPVSPPPPSPPPGARP